MAPSVAGRVGPKSPIWAFCSKLKNFPSFTLQFCVIILIAVSSVRCDNQRCDKNDDSQHHDEVKPAQETADKPSEKETVFTKIIRGEIPAKIIYRDEKCIAFQDIDPVAPIHFLVVPLKPIPSLSHAESKDQNLLGHLLLVAKDMAEKEGAENGYRVVINNETDSVNHLHLHVIGGRPLGWPPG